VVLWTPEKQLREVCLRITRPRVAVVTEVSAHSYADGDTLTLRVRSRLGSVSTQTVYDVLRALKDAELIHRIERARSPARLEARVGDNLHHVVCRSCGGVAARTVQPARPRAWKRATRMASSSAKPK
jgi:Fe2+ or Zn2+ uptake regulation protein